MTDSRISSFLKQHSFSEELLPLTPEASVRRYYRVKNSEGTAVLCIDPNFKSEDYPFLLVQKFLKENHFRVPEIIGHSSELGLFLLEDCGDTDLSHINDEDKYEGYVKKSLDMILKLQDHQPIPVISSRSFDTAKLEFEISHTSSGYERLKEKYGFKSDLNFRIMNFMKDVVSYLAMYEDKKITHRDFHARNILLHQNELILIDFQDMMMGVPEYDLTSILYDAYKKVDMSFREKYYDYFTSNLQGKHSKFRERYLYQSLQRSFKALGTYIVMFNDKGMEKYRASITPCLENLIEIVQLGRFPDSLYLFFTDFLKEWQDFQTENV